MYQFSIMTARSKFVFQTASPVREQSVQNVVLVPHNCSSLATVYRLKHELAANDPVRYLACVSSDKYAACLPGLTRAHPSQLRSLQVLLVLVCAAMHWPSVRVLIINISHTCTCIAVEVVSSRYFCTFCAISELFAAHQWQQKLT